MFKCWPKAEQVEPATPEPVDQQLTASVRWYLQAERADYAAPKTPVVAAADRQRHKELAATAEMRSAPQADLADQEKD